MQSKGLSTNEHLKMTIIHLQKGNPAICNPMEDIKGIMLGEVSQKETYKYCMIMVICGIYKSHICSNRQ